VSGECCNYQQQQNYIVIVFLADNTQMIEPRLVLRQRVQCKNNKDVVYIWKR